MRYDLDVQRAASSYQLGLPRMPVAGRAGELMGRGTGSSLEFQEYREYMPGDDIRHVDWAAFARSDSLMVRLYREEISPRVQVLLDCSRSMSTGQGAKSLVARQLAALFAILSGQLGGRPEVVPLDDTRPARRLPIDSLDSLQSIPMNGLCTMAQLLADHAIPPARRAVRVVISDCLFPHEPDSFIQQLAGQTSALWIVQVLTAWEADPSLDGGRKLVDIETGNETDLILDRKTVAGYRERLKRAQDELARSCRRAHARFVTLVADKGLQAVCRDELCRSEMLRPT